MEKVSTPYDLACNAALLAAYGVSFAYSVRMLYRYFNKDRFIQLMQYLVSVFYACEVKLGRLINILVVFADIPGLNYDVTYFAPVILVFCAAEIVTYLWLLVLTRFLKSWERRKKSIAYLYAFGNVVIIALHLTFGFVLFIDNEAHNTKM
mmetsp:Transcript_18586/g.33580  ORF Transcript_18586/g.33580 Transcript_18586/m.33580 type:complete len:150 (-) Transcript_18586:1057-1506(-)